MVLLPGKGIVMGDPVAVADAPVREPLPLMGSSVEVEFARGNEENVTGLAGGVEIRVVVSGPSEPRVVVPATDVWPMVAEKGGILKDVGNSVDVLDVFVAPDKTELGVKGE